MHSCRFLTDDIEFQLNAKESSGYFVGFEEVTKGRQGKVLRCFMKFQGVSRGASGGLKVVSRGLHWIFIKVSDSFLCQRQFCMCMSSCGGHEDALCIHYKKILDRPKTSAWSCLMNTPLQLWQ